MDRIAIEVEPAACEKLRAHLSHELAHAYTPQISRKAQKLSPNQLLEARCRDEEVTATVSERSGAEHRVRMVFPLFDDSGYSFTQCSCLERFVGFDDERRCHHMWIAQEQVLARLNGMAKLQAEKNTPLAKLFAEACATAVTEAPASTPSLPAQTAKPRLAWLLRPDMRFELRLSSAKAAASTAPQDVVKGRGVSRLEFLQSPALWLNPQDQLAAAHLHIAAQEAPGTGVELSLALLEDLNGHPDLYGCDAPSSDASDGLLAPLRLQKAALSLGVVTSQQGLSLRAYLQAEALIGNMAMLLPGGGCCVYAPASHTLYYAATTPPLHGLLAFVLQHSTSVIPPRHKSWLLKSLGSVQHLLSLHMAPQDLGSSKQRQAAPQLFLRLTPMQPQGALLEMLQKPSFSCDYFQPGQGPASLWEFADDEASACLVTRQLADEEHLATQVASNLQLKALADELAPFVWRLSADDAVLSVLDTLNAKPSWHEQVFVVWPKGAEQAYEVVDPPEGEDAKISATVKRHHDWFELQGQFVLNGQVVNLADLLNAISQGRPYLKLAHGQWLRISAVFRQRLAELLAYTDLRPHNDGPPELSMPVAAAPALAQLAAQGQLSLEDQTAGLWQASAERFAAAQAQPVTIPSGLCANLRPYQKQGFEWLYRLASWQMGAILADDMGLGKTLQTIAVLLATSQDGASLIIAPTSVVANWEAELKRFAPSLSCVTLQGSSGAALPSLGAGTVLLASYGLVQRQADKLARLPWRNLVLDEAQMIKNASSKTARILKTIPRQWTLALTGTPIENHLGELWSLFDAVQPGLLGNWEEFREQYARPIEQHAQCPAKAKLQTRIAPFILRRSKQEHLKELPEKTEIMHSIVLAADERRLYDQMRLEAAAAIAKLDAKADDREDAASTDSEQAPAAGKKTMEALAYLTRLRQLACHPRLLEPEWLGESAKEKHFLEICQELQSNGHRSLVFSQFASFLTILRQSLERQGLKALYLDGATPTSVRRDLVNRFQAGEGDFFLISLKAGGTGLNLTAADYVIHMDPWWNPAVEAQASDRAHRMGQKKPVTIYRFITYQSVEEKILQLHAQKQFLAADILGKSSKPTKLNFATLKDLLTQP